MYIHYIVYMYMLISVYWFYIPSTRVNHIISILHDIVKKKYTLSIAIIAIMPLKVLLVLSWHGPGSQVDPICADPHWRRIINM